MVRVAMVALGATLTFGAMAPQDAAAQMSGRERSEAAKRGGVIVDGRRDSRIDERCYDYNDRYDRRDPRNNRNDRDRYERRRNDRYNCDDRDSDRRYGNAKNSSGPKFCQDGRGHPVHGMKWCREKGWGGRYTLRNVGWGDVILRRPREVARRDLGRSVLQDVLGRTVYGRFDAQRDRLGLSGPLVGYWSDTGRGSELNLFAGGVQVAQILDRNRDGRADVVLVASR